MIVTLLETPRTSEQRARWSFQHRDAHQQVRQAIQAKGGPVLPDYQLDPIADNDLQGWLQRHSQSHGDANQALGLQGVDLLDVDFNDEKQFAAWIWLNFQEHRAWSSVLGVS